MWQRFLRAAPMDSGDCGRQKAAFDSLTFEEGSAGGAAVIGSIE